MPHIVQGYDIDEIFRRGVPRNFHDLPDAVKDALVRKDKERQLAPGEKRKFKEVRAWGPGHLSTITYFSQYNALPARAPLKADVLPKPGPSAEPTNVQVPVPAPAPSAPPPPAASETPVPAASIIAPSPVEPTAQEPKTTKEASFQFNWQLPAGYWEKKAQVEEARKRWREVGAIFPVETFGNTQNAGQQIRPERPLPENYLWYPDIGGWGPPAPPAPTTPTAAQPSAVSAPPAQVASSSTSSEPTPPVLLDRPSMPRNGTDQGPMLGTGKTRQGRLTGIVRPKWPQVVRPYTKHTRAHIVGNRPTGILDNRYYAKDIIGSDTFTPFLSPHATTGQRGSEAVVGGIRAFQPGPHHWLFGS